MGNTAVLPVRSLCHHDNDDVRINPEQTTIKYPSAGIENQ